MRILVADSQVLFRAGLCHLLGRLGGPLEVFEVGSYPDLIAGIRDERGFDLILVDLLLPGVESFERFQELCELAGPVPVVVVSVRDRSLDVQLAIKAGASGYIPKSSNPNVMIGALKLVLSGGLYLPPNVLHLADPSGAEPSAQAGGSAQEPSYTRLTGRQQEVMALLAQGKSNKEIARDLGLSSGTVKIHISNIFKTLNVRNRIQAVIATEGSFAGPEQDADGWHSAGRGIPAGRSVPE